MRVHPAWRGESDFPDANETGAQTGDITGIGRYFRLEEDDM